MLRLDARRGNTKEDGRSSTLQSRTLFVSGVGEADAREADAHGWEVRRLPRSHEVYSAFGALIFPQRASLLETPAGAGIHEYELKSRIRSRERGAARHGRS
jgi:hypothetical protein